MRCRTLFLCLFVLLQVSQFARPAQAAPCGPFTVAFYEHGALYWQRADGSWTGIDKDIVDELARRTGCRFEGQLESRVRIWAMLAAGQLDMSVSGLATAERELHSHFVPYLSSRIYLLVNPSVADTVMSLDDFAADARYKVATVSGFRHGPALDAWLDQLRASGRVHGAADFRSLMRLLEIGRVDAVLALQTSWAPLRSQQRAAGWRAKDWSPRSVLVGGLVLSRKRIPPEVVKLFETTIAAMREDGTILAIATRHVGPELAPTLLLQN